MTDEFGLTKNDKFVDIHGREISTTSIDRKCEELCLLSDLKQTGVTIYRKSQYAKLSTIDKDFGPDFVDFMLERAKSYMLANKIPFTQEQIMSSIENAKQVLTTHRNIPPRVKKDFLTNRKVETGSDEEIHIRVSTSNLTTSPTPPKQISPAFKIIPVKSPRQPPIGKETDSSSDVETKSVKKKSDGKNLNPNGAANAEITKKSPGTKTAPKLQQCKNQGPKRFSYNIPLKQHDVIVTRIDKRNCVWVRDLANTGLLQQIHKKVNEEAKYQPVAAKPWQLEKVYMAQDEDAWFRCKIVRFNPLTVFFLDYGNVAEVNKIKDISSELAKTPNMAIRITFKEVQYTPRLEDEIRIQPFLQNDDGTFFVDVLSDKSNPAEPIIGTPTSSKNQKEENSNPKLGDDEDWDDWKETDDKNLKEAEAPVFFKKPRNVCTVSHDQRVVIVAEKEGEFFLRTKECYEKLREVENAIENYIKTAKSIKNVVREQVVLHESRDGKIYRAIVNKVNKNSVGIELLDYPKSVTVELATVKSIDARLSNEPVTFFSGGKLYGFEEEPLSEDCKKFVEECINKRQKFTVVLGFDDELDLFDGSQLLSEQLKKVKNGPKRVFLKEMKTFTPETGLRPYLCGSYKNSKYFSLVPSNELQKNIDQILRLEVEDKTPYAPVAEEICLCFYVDNWYRCVVTRVFDKEYEVLLIDFGNTELMKKENLRKPHDDVAKIPVLALPCVLINLPQHPKVEDLLRKMLIEGELYTVDLKQMSEGKWQVEIPSVYKKIRENIA